jgi:streptogramin lyase
MFRGREIDTAGDGFFAAFDVPVRAVRCATAIVDGMWERGIAVRAGLHTGECERVGRKLGGIAVHIGSRVAGLAGAGEILVTGTVRDLATGSGLRFGGKGTHDLRGVPGEWSIFGILQHEREPLPPLEPAPDAEGEGGRGALGRMGRSVVVGIVVALAGAVALALMLTQGDEPAAKGPLGAPSAASHFVGLMGIDARDDGEAIRIPFALSRNPYTVGQDVATGFGYVWVSDTYNRRIEKVNPSGSVVATIPVADPVALAVAGSDVWVTTGTPIATGQGLVHIDPTTNATLESIDIATCCGGIVASGGSLWVLGHDSLWRVDPRSGRSSEIDLGGQAIVAGAGRLWVLDAVVGKVTSVDVRTGRRGKAQLLSGRPVAIAYGFEALWVLDGDGRIGKFPVSGDAAVETVSVGKGPAGIAVGEGSVWVANADDGTVSKIEPGSMTVESIPVGGKPTRLTVSGGIVWVVESPAG